MDTLDVAKELAELVGIEHGQAIHIVDQTMDEELENERGRLRSLGKIGAISPRRYRAVLDRTRKMLNVWATTDLSDRVIPRYNSEGSSSGIGDRWTVDLDDMADWVLRCRWGFVVVGLLAERKRRKAVSSSTTGPRPLEDRDHCPAFQDPPEPCPLTREACERDHIHVNARTGE